MSALTKIPPVGIELFHVDEQAWRS